MAIGDTARYGYTTSFCVGLETTWGEVPTALFPTEFLSESLSHIVEEIPIESINTTRDYQRRFTGSEHVEGGVEMHFNPAQRACINILQASIGGSTTSTQIATTGAYRHVLSVGELDISDVEGLTLQVINGVDSSTSEGITFLGCKVNSWTLKSEIGSPVIMTTEFIGKTATTTSSTPAGSFTYCPPVNFTGITIQAGNTPASVTSECFTGFELTINNNLVSDSSVRCLGSKTLATLPATRREVKLKLTQRFDTTTSYDRFIGGSMCAIAILLDTGHSTGSSGGSTASMIIYLPTVYYNSNNFQVSDFGVLTNELDLTAIKDPSTLAYIIQFQIVNTTSSY